jgi:hypothetical protein
VRCHRPGRRVQPVLGLVRVQPVLGLVRVQPVLGRLRAQPVLGLVRVQPVLGLVRAQQGRWRRTAWRSVITWSFRLTAT